jgi:hypothetical protein
MSSAKKLQPMNPVQKRLTQTLALSMAFCCAWYAGVRPLEARAQRAEADLVAQTQKVANGAEAVALQPQSTIKLAHVKKYIEASKAWTEPAANSTALYDKLVQLAEEMNVRLDRIDPAGSPKPVAGASATAGLAAGATGSQGRRGAIVTGAAGELQRGGYSAELTGFRLGATGSYADVLRFVVAVQHDLGATRIGQLRIASSGSDPGLVELSLDTWHMRLIEPSKGSTQAGSDSNGQPPALSEMDVPAGPPPLVPDGEPR